MKLQEYLLKKSDSNGALWLVFILTVFDSIFLFIPPEVFIAPPIVANKKKAVPVVLAAAAGSLIGGTIAYMIGAMVYDSIGQWIITTFSTPEQFTLVKDLFTKHGLWIIFLSAFTPVPYKLMAICAGFLSFNPFVFLGVSAVFRTMRFAIVGYLLWKFQKQANEIVKKYFWPLTIIAIVAAVCGVMILGLL